VSALPPPGTPTSQTSQWASPGYSAPDASGYAPSGYGAPSYGGAPPPDQRLRPRALWYWIGAALILAAVVTSISMIIAGVVSTSRSVDHFARFVAPGEATLTFTKGGTYTIYYEYRSTVDGKSYSTSSDPPPLSLTLRNASGGTVPVKAKSNEVSFSVNDRAGKSIAEFSIAGPGTYTLTADSPGNNEPFVLAIGKSVFGTLLAWAVSGLVIGFVLGVAGVVIIIVTAVKRGRRKRAAKASYPSGPGMGSPYGNASAYGPPPSAYQPAPPSYLPPGSPLPPPG
jgi:hypothetical protein